MTQTEAQLQLCGRGIAGYWPIGPDKSLIGEVDFQVGGNATYQAFKTISGSQEATRITPDKHGCRKS
jgi:hypothetical protein